MRWIRRSNERYRGGAMGVGPRRTIRGPSSRHLTAELLEDRRVLHALSTGAGDGGLSVNVDGYGAFGSAVGGIAGDAFYDPIGSIQQSGTVFESGVAIRVGNATDRQFLTSGDIAFTGGLPDPGTTGTATNATSSFSFGGLSFSLTQTVERTQDDQNQPTGSLLTQTYVITNPGASPLSFEMIRYIDGDLLFDGTLVDGGGHLRDILFETDAGGSGETDTTFVGMDAIGGTIPDTGRFEGLEFPQLELAIIAGDPLHDTIFGDSNSDGFVDAGQEYDITLAWRNLFDLAPGESATYATRTVFGSGAPDAAPIGPVANIDADVAQPEGNSGLNDLVFTVSLTEPVASAQTVVYTTVDGTATSPGDYQAQTGTLTFLPGGPLSQGITVPIVGDQNVEPNESFLLQLTGDSEVRLGRTLATGTIVNDDVGFSINDVQVFEGDSGTTDAVFTVTLTGIVQTPVTVTYTTLNDTADGGTDYIPRAGILTFVPGVFTTNVTVPVIGDKLSEDTEDFLVALENTDAILLKGIGIGTIIDVDPLPTLYVNDVQITTAGALALSATFTVALDTASGTTVRVDYFTSDGTAHDGADYLGQSGTLVFPRGVTTLQVTVPVMTPAVYTANTLFYLNLFNPILATPGDLQGAATFVFSTPPTGNFIIDDGDPGYTQTAGWTNLTNLASYQLDYNYHAAGNGSGQANWTFKYLQPGSYQVFTKWIPFSNRATNAPYTIFNGSTPIGTVLVNQQLMPVGDQSNHIVWQSLGTFTTTTGTLSVRLGDNANGLVVADAVRLVAGGIGPQEAEMDVASFDHSIATGDMSPEFDDGTDFGEMPATTNAVTHTFVVTNNGNADLHLTGVPRISVEGANPQDFTVVAEPDFTVGPGRTSTFKLVYRATDVGLRQAIISIANDDDSEHPYTFAVQATALGDGPPVVAAHNAAMPLDVNADTRISSLDALLIINRLILASTPIVASPSALPLTADFSAAPAAAPAPSGAGGNYYVDVNGDGIVSPRDALMVINYLNSQGSHSSSAGISASPSAAPALQALAVDQAIRQMTMPAADEPPANPAINVGAASAAIASATSQPAAISAALPPPSAQSVARKSGEVTGLDWLDEPL